MRCSIGGRLALSAGRSTLVMLTLGAWLGIGLADAHGALPHGQRQAAVSLSAATTAVGGGALVVATGKVSHAPSGAVVVVERRSAAKWTRAGRIAISHARFRLSFELSDNAVTWRLRASLLKAHRWLARSRVLTLIVDRGSSGGVKGFGPISALTPGVVPSSGAGDGNVSTPVTAEPPSPAPLIVSAPAAVVAVGSVVQVLTPEPLVSLTSLEGSPKGAEQGVSASMRGGGVDISASAEASVGDLMLTVTGTGCTASECGRAFVITLPVSVVSMAAPVGTLETFTQASPDRLAQTDSNQLNDEVLIMLGSSEAPGTRTQADAAASAVGAVVSGGLAEEGIYQLRWTTLQDLATRIAELETQPNVTSASPSFVGETEAQATYQPTVAPAYDLPQWTWRYDQVQASQAWSQSTGSGVTVGIIDIGDAYASSPDLSHVTTLDPIVVPAAHSTHVAGLACGRANAGGMVGLAWGCPIVSTYPWDSSDAGIMQAMNRIAKTPGVRVVNMSLGVGSGCVNQQERNEIEGRITHFRVFFRRFFQDAGANIVWTFSAGNNCISGASSAWAAIPELPNVIAVAASNSDGTLASFSDYDVPVAAPGGVVPSFPQGIDPNSSCDANQILDHGACGLLSSTVVPCSAGYCPARGEMAGTSMAAPVVAGIAALVAARHPASTAAEIGHCITSTAGTAGVGSTTPPDGQPGGRYTKPELPFSGSPIPIVNAAAAVTCASPTGQAIAMGPTSGPAGFGMRVSTDSCQYLAVNFDGIAAGTWWYANGAMTTFEVATPPSLANGQHQMSFTCDSSLNGPSVWTSPGFSVTITGGPTPLTLTSYTVAAGSDLTYTSGSSEGSSVCPSLPGVSLNYLSLWLDPADGLTVTASRFVTMPDNAATETLTVPAGTPPGSYTALERCYYSANDQVGIFEFASNYGGVTVTGGSLSTEVANLAGTATRKPTEGATPRDVLRMVTRHQTSGVNTPRQIVTAPVGPE